MFLAVNSEDRDVDHHDNPPMHLGINEEPETDEAAMKLEEDNEIRYEKSKIGIGMPYEMNKISEESYESEQTEDKQVEEKLKKEEVKLINEGGFFTDIFALLIKRSKIDGRDISGMMCEMIVPFIMVLMGCGFA